MDGINQKLQDLEVDPQLYDLADAINENVGVEDVEKRVLWQLILLKDVVGAPLGVLALA